MTPAAYFATAATAGVVDTCGKFATGFNEIGDKFAVGVNVTATGGKLTPVSINDTGNKFATGVNVIKKPKSKISWHCHFKSSLYTK